MPRTLALVALGTSALLAGCQIAPPALQVNEAPSCLSDKQVDAMMQAREARQPFPAPVGLSEEGAACTRAKVVARLANTEGMRVGYKAGLTNPAVQQRFRANQPVWGALHGDMLLRDGANVSAAFGARPLYEADLLVRVRSAEINQARTPAQVLANIDQIIPFIELPDLVVDAPPKLDGNGVTAINVGARLGVQGKPLIVPVEAPQMQAMLAQLADMKVVLRDGDGKELGGGKGSDVLGHPLNAVVWLTQALAREGQALRPGQLVSLGSFSALLPPKPGLKVTASYEGVPDLQPVSVSFK
ncbi:fumarylacetoacetate hydrolase [Variovorax dokdonensis]|uniref:Fumarylacetoacetate hydrolase n=1 Tax=Variovorax dokdonensis TaxID=344883 RepID=A0ABT7NGP8_9BURK|nr:fumarylacetoacetate hydrolase [Variovorax dokdonensis]MDM0047131.1 fumarylacetoacetate hydrolase [Variovorax dokdonensis]